MKVRNSLVGLGMSAVLTFGVGGAIAPAAHAASPAAPQTQAASVVANADYSAVDSKSKRKSNGKASKAGSSSQAVPSKAASLRCWSASKRGRYFAISCSGRAYRVFVNCSNRVRYITPVLSGAKRVTMRCPAGTRALGGGAYGR